MSVRWYVAYTHPQKEHVAELNLKQQGFEAFLPKYEKIKRHARREEKVLAPLFPRYIFVQIDLEKDRWFSINSTRGVSTLLYSSDNKPARVPLQVIEGLKSQQNESGIVPLATLSLFESGETVRVKEGVFADHEAKYQKMKDGERVELLLTFMQREMKITVPLSSVEAV